MSRKAGQDRAGLGFQADDDAWLFKSAEGRRGKQKERKPTNHACSPPGKHRRCGMPFLPLGWPPGSQSQIHRLPLSLKMIDGFCGTQLLVAGLSGCTLYTCIYIFIYFLYFALHFLFMVHHQHLTNVATACVINLLFFTFLVYHFVSCDSLCHPPICVPLSY